MNFLKWGGKEAACKAAEKLVEDVGSSVIALLTYDAAAQHTKTVATKVLAAAEGDSTAKSPQVGTEDPNTDANNSSTPADTVPSADSSGRVASTEAEPADAAETSAEGGGARTELQATIEKHLVETRRMFAGDMDKVPSETDVLQWRVLSQGLMQPVHAVSQTPASEAAASPPEAEGVSPSPPPATLTASVMATPLIVLLVVNLQELSFESKKHVAQIFSMLLRKEVRWGGATKSTGDESSGGAEPPDQVPLTFKALLLRGMKNDPGSGIGEPDMMASLVHGCGNVDVALNCGIMLREAIRDAEIVDYVLNTAGGPEKYVWPFFELPGEGCMPRLHSSLFDVSSDAFLTMKDLLTRHKVPQVKTFLSNNYDMIFGEVESASKKGESAADDTGGGTGSLTGGTVGLYGSLLLGSSAETILALGGQMAHKLLKENSNNFFTRRQALKLLAELLLDRNNFQVMMKFISDQNNLKMMMYLLVDPSKNIQFEAFHVFKVFVANPRKPDVIKQVLFKRKPKLVLLLENFHMDNNDAQFVDEKELIIKTIQGLENTEAISPSGDAASTTTDEKEAAPKSAGP